MKKSNSKINISTEILEKAIKVQTYFSNKLYINLPIVRASGMIFFQRFYDINQKNPPKYLIFNIASLHLATKICESPISLQYFIRVFFESLNDPVGYQTMSEFNEINDFDRSNKDFFFETVTSQVIRSEMEIIIAIKFNFELNLPYNYIDLYLQQILNWHLDENEIKKNLHKELKHISNFLLNELQYSPIFYIYPSDLIGLIIIDESFKRIKLPLISLLNQNWFNIILPHYTKEYYFQVNSEVNFYFTLKFSTSGLSLVQNRRTKITDKDFLTWKTIPLLIKSIEPLCPPPPLDLLNNYFINDNSFTQLDSDHLPFNKPPPLVYNKNYKSKELERMKKELLNLNYEKQNYYNKNKYNYYEKEKTFYIKKNLY